MAQSTNITTALRPVMQAVSQAKARNDVFLGTKYQEFAQDVLGLGSDIMKSIGAQNKEDIDAFNKSSAEDSPIDESGMPRQTEKVTQDYSIQDQLNMIQKSSDQLIQQPTAVDPSLDPVVLQSKADAIKEQNDLAYSAIKKNNNPLKKEDPQNTIDINTSKQNLRKIKSDDSYIKQLKEAVLKTMSPDASRDAQPTLGEAANTNNILSGEFDKRIVWNPTINGEKMVGAYYKQNENELVHVSKVQVVRSTDPKFDQKLAALPTKARTLMRKGQWNEDAERQIFSELDEVMKDEASAREHIFNGFKADASTGLNESFANVFLDQQLANQDVKRTIDPSEFGSNILNQDKRGANKLKESKQNKLGTTLAGIRPDERELLLHDLKNKDLREEYKKYYFNTIKGIAEAEKSQMMLDNLNKATGSKFTADRMNDFNKFKTSYEASHLQEGANLINMPDGGYARYIDKGGYQLYNKNSVIIEGDGGTLNDQDLISMAGLPSWIKVKRRDLSKEVSSDDPLVADFKKLP